MAGPSTDGRCSRCICGGSLFCRPQHGRCLDLGSKLRFPLHLRRHSGNDVSGDRAGGVSLRARRAGHRGARRCVVVQGRVCRRSGAGRDCSAHRTPTPFAIRAGILRGDGGDVRPRCFLLSPHALVGRKRVRRNPDERGCGPPLLRQRLRHRRLAEKPGARCGGCGGHRHRGIRVSLVDDRRSCRSDWFTASNRGRRVLPRLGAPADRRADRRRPRSHVPAHHLRCILHRLDATRAAQRDAGLVRLRPDRAALRAHRARPLRRAAALRRAAGILAAADRGLLHSRSGGAARSVRREGVSHCFLPRNVLRLERRPRWSAERNHSNDSRRDDERDAGRHHAQLPDQHDDASELPYLHAAGDRGPGDRIGRDRGVASPAARSSGGRQP